MSRWSREISTNCTIFDESQLNLRCAKPLSSKVIYESASLSRITESEIDGKKLVTPTYFPAVSSYGIKYSFCSLIRLLTTYSYPRILVSAYDFHLLDSKNKRRLSSEISEYLEKGCFVFLDSGIFESFWKADAEWTYSLYKASISQIDFDFYSSFDVLPDVRDLRKFEKETFDRILASRNLSNKPGFVPILHGVNPNELVSLVTKFVEIYPNFSNFIVEKARTVVKIRKVLDDDDHNRILHILGCGNPVSLLLLSYCGADSFDSLDWIKHVIDQKHLTINDFSHLELINCECSICADTERGYTEKVLLHNLLFYQNYMLQIQSLIRTDEMSKFSRELVGQDVLNRISRTKT
jgi:queuine/archaeosine tRNA-ribosyltransferase